jgi:REP element-mobilizing transposase RayT
MGRLNFLCDSTTPYHVTNRCINKEWFAQPMDVVWNIFTNSLQFAIYAFELKVHAFVLMNNHFHLLVSAPNGNLSSAMGYWQSSVGRELAHSAGRLNHIFARRFKRCRIGTYQYYLNAYKYVYLNPVKAEIVTNIEEYKYSTLPGIIGLAHADLSVWDDILIEDVSATLKWLNRNPKDELYDAVGRALRRSKFKLPTQGSLELKRMREDPDFIL